MYTLPLVLSVAAAWASEPDPSAGEGALAALLPESAPGASVERRTAQCASSPRLSLHRGAVVDSHDLFAVPGSDPWPLLTPSASNASWVRVSRALSSGQLPSPGSARPEELIDALPADDAPPGRGELLALRAEGARSPWDPEVTFVRVSLTARSPDPSGRAPVAAAIVADARTDSVESMSALREILGELTGALRPDDRLAVIGGDGLILPLSPIGDGSEVARALAAVGAGSQPLPTSLMLGYQQLQGAPEEVRRVFLLSDGDLSLIERGDELSMLASSMAAEGNGLHAIGYGDRFGRDESVEALARASGGSYLHVGGGEAERLLGAHLSSLVEPVVRDLQLLVDWGPAVIGVHRSGHHHDRLPGFSSSPVGRDLGAGETVSVVYELKTAQVGPGSALGSAHVRAIWAGEDEPRALRTAIVAPAVSLTAASADLRLSVSAGRLAEMLGRERPTDRAREVLVLAEGAARAGRPEDGELVEMIREATPLLRAPRCW